MRVFVIVAVAVTAGCGPGDRGATAITGRLHATLPSIAVVGEPVDLVVVPLTEIGVPDPEWRGRLEVEATDPDLRSPAPFRASGVGSLVMEGVRFATPGLHRVTVRSDSFTSRIWTCVMSRLSGSIQMRAHSILDEPLTGWRRHGVRNLAASISLPVWASNAAFADPAIGGGAKSALALRWTLSIIFYPHGRPGDRPGG